MKRFLNRPNLIFLSLVLGLFFGWLVNGTRLMERENGWLPVILSVGGDLFKNLVLMVVIPLVVFSLICGMMSLGDVRRLGRVALKTVVFYACTAVLACVIGLGLVNLVKPGLMMDQEKRDEIAEKYEGKRKEIVASMEAHKKPGERFANFFRSIVPKNVVASLAEGKMLPVIFFSLLFGLTATTLAQNQRGPLTTVFEAIQEVMIRMVDLVMWAAPVGVFCLIALAGATIGTSVLTALAAYFLVVVAGLLLQFFIVYGGALKLLTRLSFRNYLKACYPALVTAFSTSSSAASLAVNMECTTKRLNVSRGVAGFVLPIGTTLNMDGTAIMQAVAAVFIAQLYSIDIGLTGQLTIVLMAMLAAIGTAPVPSAGIAMLVLILDNLGIPAVGLALIWAVDRPLDMLRTVINVVADGLAAAAVGTTEGEDVRYIPEEAPTPVSDPPSSP